MRMKIQLDIIFEIRHISNVILIVLCDTKSLFVKMRFYCNNCLYNFLKARISLAYLWLRFAWLCIFSRRLLLFLTLNFYIIQIFYEMFEIRGFMALFDMFFSPKTFLGKTENICEFILLTHCALKTIATLHVHHKKIWWIFDRSENLKLCKIP